MRDDKQSVDVDRDAPCSRKQSCESHDGPQLRSTCVAGSRAPVVVVASHGAIDHPVNDATGDA